MVSGVLISAGIIEIPAETPESKLAKLKSSDLFINPVDLPKSDRES